MNFKSKSYQTSLICISFVLQPAWLVILLGSARAGESAKRQSREIPRGQRVGGNEKLFSHFRAPSPTKPPAPQTVVL